MRKFFFIGLISVIVGSCTSGSEGAANDELAVPGVHTNTSEKNTDTILEARLKNGLWAYFDFNGSLNDKSGNGRHMTGYNNIPLSTDAFGNEMGALDFDGYNHYAAIEAGTTFPATDFTVSLLLSSNILQGMIFQKADLLSATGASLGLGFDDDNEDNDTLTNLTYNIDLNENICWSSVNSANFLFVQKKIEAATWYLVTMTFDQGMQKFYVNGKLVGSKQRANQLVPECNNATFNLGIWWQSDTHFFSGKMDELRIYSRPLQDDEVLYLSKQLLP